MPKKPKPKIRTGRFRTTDPPPLMRVEVDFGIVTTNTQRAALVALFHLEDQFGIKVLSVSRALEDIVRFALDTNPERLKELLGDRSGERANEDDMVKKMRDVGFRFRGDED